MEMWPPSGVAAHRLVGKAGGVRFMAAPVRRADTEEGTGPVSAQGRTHGPREGGQDRSQPPINSCGTLGWS